METKPFWASKTFWGLVLGVVAPFVLQFSDITLDQAGWAEDIAQVIGGILILWGRVTATTGIRFF